MTTKTTKRGRGDPDPEVLFLSAIKKTPYTPPGVCVSHSFQVLFFVKRATTLPMLYCEWKRQHSFPKKRRKRKKPPSSLNPKTCDTRSPAPQYVYNPDLSPARPGFPSKLIQRNEKKCDKATRKGGKEEENFDSFDVSQLAKALMRIPYSPLPKINTRKAVTRKKSAESC